VRLETLIPLMMQKKARLRLMAQAGF